VDTVPALLRQLRAAPGDDRAELRLATAIERENGFTFRERVESILERANKGTRTDSARVTLDDVRKTAQVLLANEEPVAWAWAARRKGVVMLVRSHLEAWGETVVLGAARCLPGAGASSHTNSDFISPWTDLVPQDGEVHRNRIRHRGLVEPLRMFMSAFPSKHDARKVRDLTDLSGLKHKHADRRGEHVPGCPSIGKIIIGDWPTWQNVQAWRRCPDSPPYTTERRENLTGIAGVELVAGVETVETVTWERGIRRVTSARKRVLRPPEGVSVEHRCPSCNVSTLPANPMRYAKTFNVLRTRDKKTKRGVVPVWLRDPLREWCFTGSPDRTHIPIGWFRALVAGDR
jgi:hypothetical protein